MVPALPGQETLNIVKTAVRFMIQFNQMISVGQKIDDYFDKEVWAADLVSLGKLKALQIRALRLVYIILKGFLDEQLTLRATGLVYTILLTLVPLLAVSFSVVKAFGVDIKLLILLYYFLEPLGPKGVDLSMQIIEFVQNVKISVLGSIGLAMLIYTVLSTVQKMESALNYVWHIKDTRVFFRRFSNYLSVMLIGPVLAFSAIGITASLMSSSIIKKLSSFEAFGFMLFFAGKFVPYVLICIAFTSVYVFLPNTKVRFRAALVGGITAGILWQTTGLIFTAFVASSAQYSAIYSGFAVVILFLIWLYWSFLILLVGAKVSFYWQHPGFSAAGPKTFIADYRLKERAAITVIYLIGYNFYHSLANWTFDSLAKRTGLPPGFLHEVIAALRTKGLIFLSNDEPAVFVPARDIENITMKEVVDSVRASGSHSFEPENSQSLFPEVDGVIRQTDDAINASLEKETVKGLVLSSHKTESGG